MTALPVIDHIGIAVDSIETGLAIYTSLGIAVEAIEEVADQGVRVALLPVGETRIELLEPVSDDSPIARHLDRRGPGLHHICFRVADIRLAMARLEEDGFDLLSKEPLEGAHGCLVCFVHPKTAGGVLIELSQPSVPRES